MIGPSFLSLNCTVYKSSSYIFARTNLVTSMGWGFFIAYLGYGSEWRKQRAIIQHYFSKDKGKEYRPIQIREARILTRNLLLSAEDKLKQFLRYLWPFHSVMASKLILQKSFSTAIIIDINYGHQIVSDDDPYVKITADCSRVAAESGPPGGTPIDMFPFRGYFRSSTSYLADF